MRVVVAIRALAWRYVDMPDIWLMVHADVPRTLIDYVQESGRASRNSRLSRAVIVGSYSSNDNMQQYMQAMCRCSMLDAYLDSNIRE